MHGGDIYRNNIETDFSVNINPMGMPSKAWEAVMAAKESIGKYPDINCEELRKKLSGYHNVPMDRIVCGNGASELIQSICFMTHARSALLNAPSFSGYERALNNCGARIYYNYLNANEDFKVTDTFTEKVISAHPDLVFITNPNNPDGNLVDENIRKQIVRACHDADSLLIVDECFIEMTLDGEAASFMHDVSGGDNCIIIRAFTKSYGMPGIRLGYAICSDVRLSDKLSRFLSEWNVSSISQDVGCAVAGDDVYLQKSRELIARERIFIMDELKKMDMKVYPSDANFILFEDRQYDKRNLYELMLKRGILIRDCSDYMGLKKGHYRIAVRSHTENEHLIKALGEV